MNLDFREIFSAFMVLFAVIDITGAIPIILDIKEKGGGVKPIMASLVALGIFLAFFFIGEPLLGVFGVDIYSFAIAGSFVLFFIALEMVLGVQFFKSESLKHASIVPIAFPLVAGAGSITTLLSLKAEYNATNLLIALVLNIVIVYVVLRATKFFERILGHTGIAILRKVFGIILLAIAIKLFTTNTGIHLGKLH
ncbi:MAG: hypothetical protein A2275_05545 [Bacteroidetes bacterium RIFOXYA12_FULL_35_11]|nr:MAG: hypothetical protein A2X01_16495 [Bacteroidetes bacterium GWF2_35_48]OFY79536.1 MAG: hypothetical protein A2275_05545 [Bacteroidetes bacterium RIFOXYA12_FULL_35_11]OFY92730.1 MAG: hypothetical protein A2491_21005 [Bacteroidetes bacterium RIFOXYC12_FULL_35_7]OFY94949.1 MAG: hypothetical protein A2309_14515 [Bacteroidetes bacterium RIFOXYB2_FULL_35_7]HBX53438.1 hypothetical protein [Bacteroidales bacterium]